MPRTNQDGKDLKLVLEWLCRRHIPDTELAAALDIPPTNYSRRKDADNFPTYEELEAFAAHFGLSKRALQIAFGLRDRDELILLDEDELRQYVEQGGGETPPHPPLGTTPLMQHAVGTMTRRRTRRFDAPAGP